MNEQTFSFIELLLEPKKQMKNQLKKQKVKFTHLSFKCWPLASLLSSNWAWEMEMGNGKGEMGNGKREMGNGKWEMGKGNGKFELGNVNWNGK